MAVTILVHVQPRAKRTEVVGWHGDAVKIRLAAPPVAGAANAELVRFLADRLDVPRASVTLVAGAAGRRKRVTVRGVTEADALKRLGIISSI
jgi:uncharacterized protein (TIGR00251 family)